MTKKERERLIDRAVSFIRFHTKKSSMILGNIVIEELEQVKKFDLDDVVGRSEQLKAFAEMVAKDDFAYLKDAETLLKDFESL